jgi:hypothetical protein
MKINHLPVQLASLHESAAPAQLPTLYESQKAEPKPFDEMRLDSDGVKRSLEKLQKKGYFTIPVSATTKKFLEAQNIDNATDGPRSKRIDFSGTEHESVVKNFASKVVSQINEQKTTLKTDACEVRWPNGTGASEWHQDSKFRSFVCTTTIKGGGTEFVTPETLKSKFNIQKQPRDDIRPKGGDQAIKDDIKHAKKDKFIFFAALGIEAEYIPKLGHRAPIETNREIFLARFDQVKKKPI